MGKRQICYSILFHFNPSISSVFHSPTSLAEITYFGRKCTKQFHFWLKTNSFNKSFRESYDIIFHYWEILNLAFKSLYYSLPIFSSVNKSIVTVSVQSTQQGLAGDYFILYSILSNHRTSICSHTNWPIYFIQFIMEKKYPFSA